MSGPGCIGNPSAPDDLAERPLTLTLSQRERGFATPGVVCIGDLFDLRLEGKPGFRARDPPSLDGIPH